MRPPDSSPDSIAADLFDGHPEPEAAAARVATLLDAAREAQPERLERAATDQPEPLRQVLRALAGVAPFLVRFLARDPDAWLELVEDDLSLPRSISSYRIRIDNALADAASDGTPPGDALRRVKIAELARIVVRDATETLVPEKHVAETLAELSRLAEALLTAALELATRELGAQHGAPVWKNAAGDDASLAFAVLGLGKLGGEELNFSSDVDLIYVHQLPAEGTALHDGPGDLAPAEYFTQLARRFGQIVEEATAEGFLYRVDLDLRPQGGQGALVVSAAALAEYYDGWAAQWEKSAFMKARPVAGDLAFGWRAVKSVDPMIYSSSIDFAALESLRDMKSRVEAAHHGAENDVKLGPGGIRDVEFVAQALQLLHGGRAPQVRGRSAPGALRALAEIGAIEPDVAEGLLSAYRFLRRVENRLQMEAERQTHRLPTNPAPRARLAWSLGLEDAEALDAQLLAHRERVRQRFESLFPVETDARIHELFARSAGSMLGVSGFRDQLAHLVGRLAAAVEVSADPDRALANLGRFFEGIGQRPFYIGLLVDRPELATRLVRTFGASRFLSTVLATHPELIEPVFADPERLLHAKQEMREDLAALGAELRQQDRDEEEVGLAALRLFQMRELVNVGLLDLDGRIGLEQAEAALTDVADVCLEAGLELAEQSLLRRRPGDAAILETGRFLVVGLGKLGTGELSYGSDLDVIFLFDGPGEGPAIAEAQDTYVRLAQKLGWALQTRTAEGVCYEVDARLRPSGNQGVLVTSLAAFERYHQGSAAAWERQALLRARPVVGSDELARSFVALRDDILGRPLPDDLASEMHRIRGRMEEELAKERGERRDLKTGRGGLLDVEMIVQLLQLRHGPDDRALLEPCPLHEMLGRMRDRDLLPAQDVATLSEGWSFLRRLSSRLRVVENRSISDLTLDRGDLDSVARAMGYPSNQHSGTARLPLLDDYRHHTEAIRGIYQRVFATGGS